MKKVILSTFSTLFLLAFLDILYIYNGVVPAFYSRNDWLSLSDASGHVPDGVSEELYNRRYLAKRCYYWTGVVVMRRNFDLREKCDTIYIRNGNLTRFK